MAKAPCPTIDIRCLLWAGSSINGIRYLRAIGCFSMSQCATGPARERKVCPGRAAAEGFSPTSPPAHWIGPESRGFV